MNRRWLLVSGGAVLGAAWLGPLPAMTQQSFAAHMSLHVTVIAIAAPLLAAGIAGGRFDPVRVADVMFSPIPVSILELVVVWAWHAPMLHGLARESSAVFFVEQASFLVTGLLVWLAAFGGTPAQQRRRAVGGVSALLLTSMHMTLLGVLLTVASRHLYEHGHANVFGLTPLEDQQLGGVIMLFVGGSAYLAGALYRVAGLLKENDSAVSTG